MKSYLLCAVVQSILVYNGASSLPNQQSETGVVGRNELPQRRLSTHAPVSSTTTAKHTDGPSTTTRPSTTSTESLLSKKLDNVSVQVDSNNKLLLKIEQQQVYMANHQAEETNMDSPFFRNIRGLLMVDRFSSGGKWSFLRTGLLSLVESDNASYQQLQDLPGEDALPMDDIVDKGYTQLLEVLLNYGLYVDTAGSGSNEDTFLHLAAWYNHTDVAQLVLQRGANISARNSKGNTPLVLAAYRDSLSVLKLLVNKSANVDAANDDGDTGLHYAAQKGFMEVVRFLVDSGACITLVDNDNFTAIDLAVKAGHKDIAAYLSSFEIPCSAHRKKVLEIS